MSEEQADYLAENGYVAEAMEMMGMVEPRQIITEVSGFIPVFEVVLNHYKDHITALVFGRMWQYCGMSDGVCRATIERIASDLQISGATVMRHIEKLEKGGYILDKTPERRNRPHEYMDCGKVAMKGSLSAIAQKNVRLAQKNVAIAESQLIKQDNTNIKQNIAAGAVSEIVQSANKKVDAILEYEKEFSKHAEWQGRENVPPHLLQYADWWNSQTGQIMRGGKGNNEWFKAFTQWQKEELTIFNLQEAYNHIIAWKKIIAKPSEITSAAIAIHALPKANETTKAPVTTEGHGFYV